MIVLEGHPEGLEPASIVEREGGTEGFAYCTKWWAILDERQNQDFRPSLQSGIATAPIDNQQCD